MKRVLLVILIITVLMLSLPTFAWSAEPNYASQIWVSVRKSCTSESEAPSTVRVTRWVSGVVYVGEIGKLDGSFDGTSVIYQGYIYPDESITPNHLTVPTVER